MSVKDNLNMRLNYYGGKNQEERMNTDKLRSLKKALLYSYQAQTAELADGRKFRCLINTDKVKGDYDNKILSIPFEDICLNKERIGKRTEGEEELAIKPGDVFIWSETQTHWIIYLRYLEENAYFRSDIRRCDSQIKVNDKLYWVYTRGPVETSIVWNQKASVEWSGLNYSLVMYVTKDENTVNHFRRFKKIKIHDEDGSEKTWQVVNANRYFGDGIIEVYLDEYYENTIEEGIQAEYEENKVIPEPPQDTPYIEGPLEIRPYGTFYYTIKNVEGYGTWVVSIGEQKKILEENSDSVKLSVTNTRIKGLTLTFLQENKEISSLNITLNSL